MANKNKIPCQIDSFGGYELDGDLIGAISRLQGYMDKNPGLFDFKIEVETESGWYGDSSVIIKITANRWETDEEFKTRLEREEMQKEQSKIQAQVKKKKDEAKELELYKSLKKKYENL
jgi:hypothetical protein